MSTLALDPDNAAAPAVSHYAPPSTWRRALLAGFVAQLLLILFVTAIGLQQLRMTADNLSTVVDIHMRKLSLTKTMMTSARERTLSMFRLSMSRDPFERDELFMQFNHYGAEFAQARMALLNMPLSPRERELIALQGRMTGIAMPMQNRVVDTLRNDFNRKAEEQVLSSAIPAQNNVLAVLSQLDAETQKLALAASHKAYQAHEVARFWMYLLSGIALLLGGFVAAAVMYYTRRVSRERQHLATHDALTGLPNRMLFLDRLGQSLVRAQRRNTLVGVTLHRPGPFQARQRHPGPRHGDSSFATSPNACGRPRAPRTSWPGWAATSSAWSSMSPGSATSCRWWKKSSAS